MSDSGLKNKKFYYNKKHYEISFKIKTHLILLNFIYELSIVD
jgi:hypothetical protein